MKFAAIDIGSNAIRLLITKVYPRKSEIFYRKLDLYRLPVRLGDDVFLYKKISPEKETHILNAMHAFKQILNIYQPADLMACATSAMREAENSDAICQRILTETGIAIEIISGKREADIILANHYEENLDRSKSYIYIDVGGGSTELTIINKGKIIDSNSFNIGTIRLLKDIVDFSEWEKLELWLNDRLKGIKNCQSIGSGGNINKLKSLTKTDSKKAIGLIKLSKLYLQLKKYNYEDRMIKFSLKPDRADVILPAAEIYLTVMRLAKSKSIYVPQMGLVDGLIHILYEKHNLK